MSMGTVINVHGPTDGLHTAQNNEAKRHSAVRRHSVNKRCFVMCAWKLRQNANNLSVMNEFRLI